MHFEPQLTDIKVFSFISFIEAVLFTLGCVMARDLERSSRPSTGTNVY